MKTRTILKLMATGLLILAATVFLTACSSSTDGDPGHTDAAAEHGDDGDVDDDDMDMSDADADGHDADADADGQAYLEAAPKDSLFLVDMSNVSFTPSVLEVKTGEVIEIAIQNTEATLHDFTIDKVDADVHISYLGGTGQHEHEEAAKDADVHFALTEAGSGVVHLKINEPGEYVFYCSVTGHQAAGMEGKLIVTDA